MRLRRRKTGGWETEGRVERVGGESWPEDAAESGADDERDDRALERPHEELARQADDGAGAGRQRAVVCGLLKNEEEEARKGH